MIQQSLNPRDYPIKLKEEFDKWIYQAMMGLGWYVETLRHNTDEMRKEIQKLKEKNK